MSTKKNFHSSTLFGSPTVQDIGKEGTTFISFLSFIIFQTNNLSFYYPPKVADKLLFKYYDELVD